MRVIPVGPGKLDRGLTALLPIVTALAVALSASPWLRAYEVTGTGAFLALAAVCSVAIAALVARNLGQPPTVSYLLSALGLLALLAVMAGSNPEHLWTALTQGPTRLLTETLPLTGTPAILAGPVMLTWLCGAATTELLARTRRSALGLGIPVICYVLAYADTSSASGRDDITGPLLFAALSVAALLRHRLAEQDRSAIDVTPDVSHRRMASAVGGVGGGGAGETPWRTPGWRPTITGAVLVALIATTLGIAVPTLSQMRKTPATFARHAPKTLGLIGDPVDTVAALRDDLRPLRSRVLFSVSTNQPSSGYFGIATLDDYDGGSWSFGSTFHPSGGRIPAAPSGSPGAVDDEAVTEVTQHYLLEPGYGLSYVPALDRPIEVRRLAVDADADSAMILPAVSPSGRTSYAVVSRSPELTLATVPGADGIGAIRGTLDPVARADTAIPSGTAADIATAVQFLATLTGQRPAPSVAFLQAASAALRTKERRLDPDVPTSQAQRAKVNAGGATHPTLPPTTNGGTSLAEVINAVTVQHSATPEQMATVFVMVARYLGVPARLVTGFRIVPAGGTKTETVPAGTHQVTNRQGWTWAEIPVAGIGWVVADPTPAATTSLSKPVKVPVKAPVSNATPLPHQANAVPQDQTFGQQAVAKPVHIVTPRTHDHSAVWALSLILVAALVLLSFGPGLIALRRGLRRRARRSADPATLAVGAWLELLDGLSRAGLPTPDGATTAEVATSAGRHFGFKFAGVVGETGAVADQALFAASPPDPEAAQWSWDQQRTVRREIVGTLDRRQRLRALLTVGQTPRQP